MIKSLEINSTKKSNNLVITLSENIEIISSFKKEETNILLTSKNTINSNIPSRIDEEMENFEEEINNYKIQIDSLKELIYQKENEAIKILEENEKMKNHIENLKSSLINSNRNTENNNEQSNINNNFNNTFMSKLTEDIKDDGSGLVVKEKLIKMKASLDNYKADNNNLLQQVIILYFGKFTEEILDESS